MNTAKIPVKRALVSVYDKTGLEDLARGLHEAGVEIVSTGSTAARIRELGVPVTPVDELTGFPEIMGGRVKTLHPNVHAGLLADQNNPEHMATIAEHGIPPFQLLIANLYPFSDTVASGASEEEIIEQIDIGGPAMVRGSAKNHGSMAVVTSPADYGMVLEAVRAGGFTLEQRQRLARDAFRHTASYDIAIATWFGEQVPDEDGEGNPLEFPAWMAASYELAQVPRYGENPHQSAALYVPSGVSGGLASAQQHSGKDMSRNNWVDVDAAWRAAHDQADAPCVAIIKHTNPCGIAVGISVTQAYQAANECDPLSAFGGVIATNHVVSVELARELVAKDKFTEVLVAPGYAEGALEILAAKKNLRVLEAKGTPYGGLELRHIDGGLLVQTVDRLDAPGDDSSTWTLMAGPAADELQLFSLDFAWRACRSVKSNGILLAYGLATVGIGMGQVNRVDSCKLAVARAGARAAGSVAASDAFFPFADGAQVLIDAGVRAIVEPGGSIRDDETIAACVAADVTLYFTGTRHFAH